MFAVWTLGVASANVAPPLVLLKPCVVEQWCDQTEEGQTCTASEADHSACQALSDAGWEHRCATDSTGLEETWQEVYCRSRTEHTAPNTQPPPSDAPGTVVPPSPRRCGVVSASSGAAATLALLVVGIRRRKHRV